MRKCHAHPWGKSWLSSLQRSASTIENHERNLDRLFDYVQLETGIAPAQVDFRLLVEVWYLGAYIGKGPITVRILSDFLTWHAEGTKDPDARARKRNDMLYTIRLFFRWCVRNRYLLSDPTYHLEPAKELKRVNHRKYLTPEETKKLLCAAAESGTHAPRNLAMVVTLLRAGLRPAELCGLTAADLDFTHGWIRVNGKTGEGNAPMPPALADILKRYLQSPYYQDRARRCPGMPLFPQNRSVRPYRSPNLNRLIRRLCLRGGIDRGVTTYWLRHSFATTVYRMGLHFVKVSGALRHTSLQHTTTYVHGREDRMRRLINDSPTTMLMANFHRQMLQAVPTRKYPR